MKQYEIPELEVVIMTTEGGNNVGVSGGTYTNGQNGEAYQINGEGYSWTE